MRQVNDLGYVQITESRHLQMRFQQSRMRNQLTNPELISFVLLQLYRLLPLYLCIQISTWDVAPVISHGANYCRSDSDSDVKCDSLRQLTFDRELEYEKKEQGVIWSARHWLNGNGYDVVHDFALCLGWQYSLWKCLVWR